MRTPSNNFVNILRKVCDSVYLSRLVQTLQSVCCFCYGELLQKPALGTSHLGSLCPTPLGEFAQLARVGDV